jgi:outer membrane receptor protein involved in Fe transport
VAPPRQFLPAFAQTDLHAGARWTTWTVNVFANNLTNKRGLLSGGHGDVPPYQFTYIQPRTVGASVAKEF